MGLTSNQTGAAEGHVASDAAALCIDAGGESRQAWLLRAQTRLGWSSLRLGITVGVLSLIPFIVNLLAVPSLESSAPRSFYEAAVIAFINASALGYCLGFLTWSLRKARDDLQALQPILRVDAAQIVRELHGPLTRQGMLRVVVISVIVWGVVNLLLGSTGRQLLGADPVNVLYLWSGPFFALLWFTLIYTAAILMRFANRLSDAGAHLVRIDLLATHRLATFMDIGQRTVLLAVGGLTFMVVQGGLLGSLHPAEWLPSTVLIVVLALWLLVRPMWGVHHAIKAARQNELVRLDDAIGYEESRAFEALESPRLEALLRQRDRVLAVSEWPIARSAKWRSILYFVIPPLAWVAAALVETLVDNWV